MKTSLIMIFSLMAPLLLSAQIDLQLVLVSGVFDQPVDLASAGDERLFIVEKKGLIRILRPDGEVAPVPFLDIDAKVRSSESERGLLGLAFHPDYAANGYFFVNYTNNNGNTVIARYQVSAADPDLADAAGEKILLTINQPFANHNGGDLNFGPDGYLYIGMGDGGSGGDPENNGQKRATLLGKMLRIDVDQGDPYAIPSDNPFVQDAATLDEIWALGLRNPWRFSFDRLTGDLWIGDVGQGNWEEIDFLPAGSPAGVNFGWRCYEGDAAFNTNNCGPASDYRFPVLVYRSDLPTGCSVNGGFVYRGVAFPLLYGRYLYSDYCSGRIWALHRNEAGTWVNEQLHDGPNFQYVAMGEDQRGELYLVSIEGEIFRITDKTTATQEPLRQALLIIRPNPIRDQIRIEGTLPESGLYHMQLFNVKGQKVWGSSRHLEISFVETIAADQLPRGIYLFSIQRNGRQQTLRLVKP